MANPFFEPGAARGTKVQDLFGVVARRYDLLNDLQSLGLHRLWKRRLAALARLRPGDRALDLCCGTGDVAQALAATGASVVGLDFSGPMLLAAARRLEGGRGTPATRGRSRAVGLVRGDALRTPFPDNSFDAVTISYGLRNLATPQEGLREMWRVSRPGGRLLVLDFGKPDHRLWRQLYFGYLRLCVPLLGGVFCGNREAYAYILESLRHYPAQHGVAALMRALPAAEVRVLNLLGGAMSINYGEKRV